MTPRSRSSSIVRGAAAVAAKARAVTGSKVGMTALGNRAKPVAPQASADVSNGANRTQVFTYFTKVTTNGAEVPVLYSGDRLWARVKLTLETAGPVAIGQSSQLLPVLSGKGVLLPTGQEYDVTIAKGTRLYIAATSVNRVKVVIEPLPWLEQIFATISALVAK